MFLSRPEGEELGKKPTQNDDDQACVKPHESITFDVVTKNDQIGDSYWTY
jgi:hypothetical protein